MGICFCNFQTVYKNQAHSHINTYILVVVRALQRLTHFVSLCNTAAMISLLALCGF